MKLLDADLAVEINKTIDYYFLMLIWDASKTMVLALMQYFNAELMGRVMMREDVTKTVYSVYNGKLRKATSRQGNNVMGNSFHHASSLSFSTKQHRQKIK